MKRRERFKIAVALTSIMQTGMSAVFPPLVLILLARFLINKFGLPDIIMLFAVIFGVICGFYNMIKYIHLLINRKD